MRAPSRNDGAMIDNLHYVKDLGLRSKAALENGDVRHLRPADARALGAQAQAFRRDVQPGQIDRWYDIAMANGAIGGKLIGAGGGGLPHVLCGGQDAAAACHARSRSGRGPVPLRLRRHQGRGAIAMPTECMPAVAILAGGLATRLRPVTETIPKSLIAVAGRAVHRPSAPVAAARGRRTGGALRRVILGRWCATLSATDAAFGLDVAYSFDGDRPARHRRRAQAGACRCLATPSSCFTATAISTSALRSDPARIPSQRRTRPDDRLSQRRSLGHEQRAVRRRSRRAL